MRTKPLNLVSAATEKNIMGQNANKQRNGNKPHTQILVCVACFMLM